MRNVHIIILFLLSLSAFGQPKIEKQKRDTIIDFWNQRTYDRLHGYENRVIKSDGKILYVKISFLEKSQANFEYFRITDNLFHCIEYSPDGNYKTIGNYIITDKIIGADTSMIEDITTAEMSYMIFYFRGILKTGKFIEYSNQSEFSDYWEGEYNRGKRVGIWKHMNGFELKQINYDLDSTKNIYTKNLAIESPIDSLIMLLKGRWMLRSCDNETSPRMIFTKCRTYNGRYGEDCNNNFSKTNYYDFLTKNLFYRQRGEGCFEFRETSIAGNWRIEKNSYDTYLLINYIDSKDNWKLKLIYVDRDGNLITERQ
ncbi:MAG: hypothetical protein IPP64_16095 [Bacteroidetes bacterium]|nr:hypothetical protein [Bacteroidota bacterium]